MFVSLRLSHYALETEGRSLPVIFQERQALSVCWVLYLMSLGRVLCRRLQMTETQWKRDFVSTHGEFKMGEDPVASQCSVSLAQVCGQEVSD